jgi:hypothetical protein
MVRIAECNSIEELRVAKRKQSTYKDDGNGWFKIKNRVYSQAEGRNDMMFPPPQNPE